MVLSLDSLCAYPGEFRANEIKETGDKGIHGGYLKTLADKAGVIYFA